jgi:uncharacterized membrane protein YedE/YeeE
MKLLVAMKLLVSLGSGLLFGLGMAIAGMTDPAKVLGFLDVTGTWDPTLAFVMGGALAVNAVAYALTRRRARPVFGVRFHLPTRSDIDARLVVGAAIFGLGWGLVGFCPGPALAGLASGSVTVLIFVSGLVGGTLAGRLVP